MSEQLKKRLLISLFILSVIAIGTGLYFAFFRGGLGPESPLEETGITSSGTFPIGSDAGDRTGSVIVPSDISTLPAGDEIANGGATKTTTLTNTRVTNTVLSGNGVGYYDPNDGKFYTIDKEGNVVKLSDRSFPDAENVAWNNNADKAVIEFPDGNNIIYDFNNETQVSLPKHWEEFQFSPSTDEIAAKSVGIDPNNNWIVTVNSDGSNVQAVAQLGQNADRVDIKWSPTDQVIGFADTAEGIADGFTRKRILPIGRDGKDLKGVVVEGLGFDSIWTPNGKRFMYSVFGDFSNYKPMLWIVDGTAATIGQNRRSIGLNTWIDKCTFADNSTVYCAVPQALPDNAGLRRTLYKDLPDTIYRVDLNTGRTILVGSPASKTTMENLQVSLDQSNLFFTNAHTGQLESMRLK